MVPKYLTEDQKASGITIAKELLGHFINDESKFVNYTVTGDEMWFIMLNLKQKLSQCGGSELVTHLPKKFKLSPSPDKVMLVDFWNSRGIIQAHFMPRGRPVTA